jgi:DUF2075 family protein
MFIQQYELWQTCNNNCEFCFNKELACKLLPKQQEDSLLAVYNDLDNLVAKHGGNLSIELIGGEFFQGQLSTERVRDLFFSVITKIKSFSDKGLINQVVIFVTLTIGSQKDLYSTLDILTTNKNKDFEVWVSTSYDTRGRFDTKNKLDTWHKNMLYLSKLDSIYRNTTIIFTQDFVDKVLSGELNLKEFIEKYRTTLFFKHPMPNLINTVNRDKLIKENLSEQDMYTLAKKECLKEMDWFLPERDKSIQVMCILKEQGLLSKFMDLGLRADNLFRQYNVDTGWDKTIRDKNKHIESFDEDVSECGHLIPYRCYSDSDKCIICDKENLLDD